MAYQPIQMPHVSPYSGMETLRDVLKQTQALNQHRARMLQDKEYREQQMAMQQQGQELEAQRMGQTKAYQDEDLRLRKAAGERQDRDDRGQAIEKARLMARTDPNAAVAYLSEFGISATPEQVMQAQQQAQAPQAPLAPQQAQQPQGGSPMPDGMEFGQQQPPGLEPPPLQQPYTPPGQDPRDYTYAPDVESDERIAQMGGNVPGLLQRPPNNLGEAARQQQLLHGLQRREAMAGQPAPQGPPAAQPAPPQAQGPQRYVLTRDGKQIGVLDPGEAERAANEQRQRRAGLMGETFKEFEADLFKKYGNELQAGVQAGAIKEGQELDWLLQRHDRDEARRIAEINARRPRGTGGAARERLGQADRRIALQEEASARALAKDVLAAHGFKEEEAKLRKFSMMAEQLATPNAALDAMTAGSFVKMAQGGSGVISDSDMRVFWERIGGLGVRTAEQVQAALSGKLGDEKRRIVSEALREIVGIAQSRIGEIKEQVRYAFESSPTLSGHTQWALGTFFPQERKRIESQRPAAGQGKGGQPAKAPSGVDEAMKAVFE